MVGCVLRIACTDTEFNVNDDIWRRNSHRFRRFGNSNKFLFIFGILCQVMNGFLISTPVLVDIGSGGSQLCWNARLGSSLKCGRRQVNQQFNSRKEIIQVFVRGPTLMMLFRRQKDMWTTWYLCANHITATIRMGTQCRPT